MNEQEQKVVDYLLSKMLTTSGDDLDTYSRALERVTVVARNRIEAEIIGKK